MDSYSDVVDLVYIKPIRSVIAVDDKFPTLDLLLDGAKSPLEQRAGGSAPNTVAVVTIDPAEIEKARKLVSYCRERQWIIDIHDGTRVFKNESGSNVLQHLHQTDLLILDYKLQGETLGGDYAIQILRALSSNPHFNIVVVYTKDEVVATFKEIALSLLAPHPFDNGRDRELEEIWNGWSEENQNDAKVLEGLIDETAYFYFRTRPVQATWRDLLDRFPSLAEFARRVSVKLRGRTDSTLRAEHFAMWLLYREQTKIEGKFYKDGAARIHSAATPEAGKNWLRTDKLFLTVVSKDIEGGAIIEHLRDAICDWRPSPHRLTISLMRAMLEDNGGTIEEAALNNDQLQAGLLKQLLPLGGEILTNRLSQILDHHWSEILKAMSDEILPKSTRILEIERKLANGNNDVAISRHFDWYNSADAEQRAALTIAVNSYLSTQTVEGQHLMTGHIFEYQQDHWVCLSPMCDLVPGQNQKVRWGKELGDAIPFKAVKLANLKNETALENATSNLCLFLHLKGKPRCFGYVEMGDDKEDKNPHWEQMFAADQGRFTEGPTVKVAAVRAVEGTLAIKGFENARIVAQLKYEYALNLLQRLSNNLSRVGLGHISEL